MTSQQTVSHELELELDIDEWRESSTSFELFLQNPHHILTLFPNDFGNFSFQP